MQQKKTTLATIKRFIKREFENNNLFVKTMSSFDGSVDCVMPSNGGFRKVDNVDFTDNYRLGIPGFWLVGHSRDYFKDYADPFYIGYEVSNCCGSAIIAFERLYGTATVTERGQK